MACVAFPAGLRPAYVIAPLRCRGLIEGQSACVRLHADARRSRCNLNGNSRNHIRPRPYTSQELSESRPLHAWKKESLREKTASGCLSQAAQRPPQHPAARRLPNNAPPNIPSRADCRITLGITSRRHADCRTTPGLASRRPQSAVLRASRFTISGKRAMFFRTEALYFPRRSGILFRSSQKGCCHGKRDRIQSFLSV